MNPMDLGYSMGKAARPRHLLQSTNIYLFSWHQDVKPQNILVVSSGSGNTRDWQFKLADLGISHFNPRNVGSSRQNSTASDAYGTQTYGECLIFK